MGPVGEKMIEITYEIYSKEHNISFEEYIDKIVMNEDTEIFNNLWKQAQIIYKNDI